MLVACCVFQEVFASGKAWSMAFTAVDSRYVRAVCLALKFISAAKVGGVYDGTEYLVLLVVCAASGARGSICPTVLY